MTTRIVDSERNFGLELTCRDGVATIRATGRLVVGAGADHPAWALPRTVDHAAQVVIDLHGVTAIDAGGIGRLVHLRQRFRDGGAAVVVSAAAPRVRRVLQLTRLDAIFGIASARVAADTIGRPAGPLGRCA